MKKLIKLSTCLICLGTLISGLSVTAMENNNEHVEQNQVTNENNSSKEDQDRKLREIYEQEIAKGKSDTYAKIYAALFVKFNLSEELSRRAAGLSEEEKTLKENSTTRKRKKCSKKASIVPELKKNEPEGIDLDLDLEIDEKASDESIVKSFKADEKNKRMMISAYYKQRSIGKSVLYSVEYVRQYYTIKKMTIGGMGYYYAKRLASSFEKYVLEGFSQKEARQKALGENHVISAMRNCSKVIDSKPTTLTLKRKSDDEFCKGLGSEPFEKMPKVSTPLGYGLEIDLDVDSSEESEIESESETGSESETESSSDDMT